ncbi:MAG: hypothetical protein HKO65_07380 [Gemmatimonadetes bacterium]|nr:hypothetical protein [Gemmatimonadota bacterium]
MPVTLWPTLRMAFAPKIPSAVLFMICAGLWGGGPLSSQELDPAVLGGMQARSIGPAGMSGRIASIDAVESDPNVVYVGAATGGLWKSVNGGQTWTPLFDEQRVLGIGAVAVFQPNPDIVWVGTGEGNPRNSAGVGAGIYKSLDGGNTWSLLGLEQSERIHRIVLHPTDPDIVYAGVMGPAWSDGGQRGVYKTTDGGATWRQVLFVDQKTGVSDLVMDPTNPEKLLAGMWEFRRWPWFFESGGPGSGLFVTHDGGEGWERLSADEGLPEGNLGRIGLSFSSSDPEVAYALVEAERSALLRSDDGGLTWGTVNDDEGVASRPFYYTDIFVDPENELRLFNLHSRIMRSEDGGQSFENISGDVHSDFHALWIDPNDSRLMYVGTDGGVYVTRDRGDHWRLVDNLPVGQFYHVSVDMETPYNVYGGMQDNGSWRGPSDSWENGGIRNYHWKEVGFGDGFGTLIDPTDPTFGYSMSQGGGLVRFDLRTGERKGIRPWAPDGVNLRFNWNAAIATDPFEVGTIYYGSQFVHKSPDRGASWQIISGDLTTNDPEKQRQAVSGGLTRDATGAENHTTILTIAPSPVEAEVIWVGSDDGLVHVTRSGGGDWTEVGERARDVPEGTWIPHIEASRHEAGVAYVVFEDHRRGNWEPYIFRVEEYGRRWRRIADEDDLWGFVHTIEEDPINPNLLFVGTEFGLYFSLDRGEEWHPWRHGFPPAPVRSLVVHPRDHDLVVGTHGRAIYVIDDIRPLRELAGTQGLLTLPLHLFEPPAAYLRSVSAVDGYHFAADAMFRGETRPVGAMFTYAVGGGTPDQNATLDILDLDGDVIRSMEVPVERGLNRVVWDLRETNPFGEERSGGRFQPTGPEVLPGTYEVVLRSGGAESSSRVEVLPDPRVDIPMAERIAKREAVQEASAVLATIQDLQDRLRSIHEGLDGLEALYGGRTDQQIVELRSLGDSIGAEATEIEDRVESLSRSSRQLYSLSSTRDAPTESDRIALSQAAEALGSVVSRFNAFLSGRVGDLRHALDAAGITALPNIRPVARRTGG